MRKILFIVLLTMLGQANMKAISLNFGDEGLIFAWSMEDKVGLLTANSVQMRFDVNSIEEDGHCATFASQGWLLKEDVRYYAYAPYNSQYSVRENKATALPVDFSLQQQKGNNSTDHLMQHAFYTGSVKVGKENQDATIHLRSMTSVLRLSMHVDAAMEISQVQISLDENLIPLLGNMDIVEGSFNPIGYSSTLTLKTSEMAVGEDTEAVAYMTIPACNLEGHQVMLTFTDSKGKRYEQGVEGFDIKPGCLYCIGEEMATSQARGYEPQKEGSASAPMVVGCDMPVAGSYVPTSIKTVEAERKVEKVYDLSGKSGEKTYSGVKIINGKKILTRR